MMKRAALVSILATLSTALAAGCIAETGDDSLTDDELAVDEQALDCPTPGECGGGGGDPPAPQEPPPPLPSSTPDGRQLMNPIRTAIELATQQAINDFNNDPNSPGALAWRGQGPGHCDYGCNMTMIAPLPDFPYAWTDSTVNLKHTLYTIFTRNISIGVETRAYCSNWQSGAGELLVTIKPGIATVEGGGILEGFLNFFSAGHLSAYITGKIQGGISSGGRTVLHLGKCTSLGVVRGLPNSPGLDAFIWDKPSPLPPPGGGADLP